MTKTDITMHSDSELSLLVFNDEYLYKLRKRPKELLMLLEEEYTYSQEQLEELLNDLFEDRKEENK